MRSEADPDKGDRHAGADSGDEHREVYDARWESTTSLAAGTRRGPYEVLGLIGSGAMGEDIRRTRVPERRDGGGVIVQMHASLAADKVQEVVLNNHE